MEDDSLRSTVDLHIEKMYRKFKRGIALRPLKENRLNKDSLKKFIVNGKVDMKKMIEFVEDGRKKAMSSHLQSDFDPSSSSKSTNYGEERYSALIKKIEGICKDVITDLGNDCFPKFVLRNMRLWSNIQFEERVVSMKPSTDCVKTLIKLNHKNSAHNFSVILYLLAFLHNMLINRVTFTRRELYYYSLKVVRSQSELDHAINTICCMLETPQWELGLTITSKGLIAGPLEIITNEGYIIDCNNCGGVLIPNNIVGIQSITTSAKFILVVEKDATFQKLLDEGILEKFNPCIIITGKGYPDVNTRLLLKMLVEKLKIPSLALIDGDPHGIEIMCIYKYGSLAMAHLGDKLVVPSLCWLGIFPSDVPKYGPYTTPLSQQDIKKCQDLLARPYCKEGSELHRQINIMLSNNEKTEIEGITAISISYLTDIYLPNKFIKQDFIS